MAVEPAAPPWNWNPGATFVAAFNDAQANKRANEKMAMEQELTAILLPAKRAEAEYNIKKLQFQSELLTNFHKANTAALPAAYRGVNQAVTGSGGDQASQDGQTKANPFMIDTTGANFNPTKTRAPSNSRTVVLPTE